MKDLVSVIVMVYNVQAYVQQCLQSIATQTYTNFECIVIDDGSTDASGAICDTFCRTDARFRVIHQANAGIGFTRNVGLDNAAGEYIQFVDSDDIVAPEMLETAVKAISTGLYDWISFDFAFIDLDVAPLKQVSANKTVREGKLQAGSVTDLLKGLLGGDLRVISVCNKLYSRKAIGDMRFASVNHSEDFCFNYVFLQTSPRTAHISRKLYSYRQRPGSITRSQPYKYRYGEFTSLATLLPLTSPYEQTDFRWRLLQKLFRCMLTTRYGLLGTSFYPAFMSFCRPIRKQALREYVRRKEIPLLERCLNLVMWRMPHVGHVVFKLLGN